MRRDLIVGPLFAAILTVQWPDGTIDRSPALTMDSCMLAAADSLRGIATSTSPRTGYPRKHAAANAFCTPASYPESAGFVRGWDKIKGYNDR